MPSFFDLALPLMRLLPPEAAHRLSIRAIGVGCAPRAREADPPSLAVTLWRRDFPNPIGLAAGFDKDAEVPDALLAFGFGFVEIGTVTPRPQKGNPKPRLFRLAEDRAVINRLGFNSRGVEAAARRLIARLLEARAKAAPRNPPPLLVKIAPDLSPEERADLAEVALSTGIDGLIIANTTVARPASLQSAAAHEPGGLSGRPLFAPSTALLAEMYRLTGGKLPLIGVGGIASGADAYAKIRAGASLVQLYTALVYEGPGLVRRVKRELAALLARDGFTSVMAAIGADAHLPSTTPHGL